MSQHIYSLLCLGDSYTIAESLPIHQGFPYQTVQLLRKNGLHFHAPEIVAITGYTSNQLAQQIIHTALPESFDFVTLLIGVNNQYQQLPVSDFADDYDFLLKKALHFVHNHHQRVLAISIPDWGISPFAANRNAKEIASQIDAFNKAAFNLATAHDIKWLDITTPLRQTLNAKHWAADGLHYGEAVYALWAQEVANYIKETLAKE